MLQSDSTAMVAPSADLVAWNRLGASYSPVELSDATQGRALIELQGMIRPAEDVALYRAEMAEWPGSGEVSGWRTAQSEWAGANDACRRDILDRLGREGPRLWDLAERIYPDDRPSPRLTRAGCATSYGCVPLASPAPKLRSVRSSRWTSVRPASQPWSKVSNSARSTIWLTGWSWNSRYRHDRTNDDRAPRRIDRSYGSRIHR